jgi:hypothetical protein
LEEKINELPDMTFQLGDLALSYSTSLLELGPEMNSFQAF